MIPLPNDEVTPPVTKIYFVGNLLTVYSSFFFAKILFVTDYSFIDKTFIKFFYKSAKQFKM